ETVQSVAEEVARRARRQGFIQSREVREELARAGLPETLWRDVVAAVTPALTPRAGRYYYPTPGGSARNQQEQIRHAVRKLIRAHKEAAASIERRGEDRLDFIQPAQIRTEDGRTFTLLSRDLSSTGIRLVGTKRL